jgi:Acetyltransferase (GNAT) domain
MEATKENIKLADERDFTARLCTSVASANAAEWSRLLPGQAEDWGYFRTVEICPPPAFKLGAITVTRGGTLVAVAPVFRTSFRFDTSVQGTWRRRVGDLLYARVPRLVSMDVLSLGSPLSDNSHIGIAPHLSDDHRREVLAEMLRCLAAEAKKQGVPLLAAKSLHTEEADLYQPVFDAFGYARVTTIPNVVLELPFSDLNGYLASLPEGTSSYLRRKWRSAARVSIEYPISLNGLSDEVNALYRSTLAQSSVDYGNFGPVHDDYFAAVLRNMPHRARIMLCRVNGRLLSFQLYMIGRHAVHAKGIGMRYPEAREHNLYFLNWKEMMEDCLSHGVPRISMSGTTYATKLLIGGRLERRWIFFRFRNAIFNRLMPHLAPGFDFERNDPELRELNATQVASTVAKRRQRSTRQNGRESRRERL